MGIEFRLGRSDHRVTEQFLDGEPAGVDAIIVDAPNIRIQSSVVEMAKRRNIQVVVEPLTERLSESGFDPRGLDYWNKYPLDPLTFASLKRKAELVERVVGLQADAATILVPPHFYVENEAGAKLNVDLAGLALQEFRGSKKPVRPILAASRGFLGKDDWAARIAADYRAVGIGGIDLRISPLGGEDEGPVKVASALEIAQKFGDAGIEVLLGFQPVIGHTAVALGIASGYSTGIGNREHFNYASAMSVQRKPPDAGKKRFGSPAGVFLPGAGITVPKRLAAALYSDRALRAKLVCGIGICSTDIDGPVKDPRAHYLHSRADLSDQLSQRPAQWRAAHESDRIRRALELRQLVNKNCLPDIRKTQKVNDLGTRTLESLAALIERHMSQAKSA